MEEMFIRRGFGETLVLLEGRYTKRGREEWQENHFQENEKRAAILIKGRELPLFIGASTGGEGENQKKQHRPSIYRRGEKVWRGLFLSHHCGKKGWG